MASGGDVLAAILAMYDRDEPRSARGNRFVIVGVLPREFNGISADTAPDVCASH